VAGKGPLNPWPTRTGGRPIADTLRWEKRVPAQNPRWTRRVYSVFSGPKFFFCRGISLSMSNPSPQDHPWETIAQDPAYKALVASKIRFIVPATLFFTVYYFALPIAVGYWPELMKKEIIGHVNIAYVLAFSQFFMAWILAGIYVLVAAGWDKQSSRILQRITGKK
jgi:uncharacterized membrane protein (DUF485 family)